MKLLGTVPAGVPHVRTSTGPRDRASRTATVWPHRDTDRTLVGWSWGTIAFPVSTERTSACRADLGRDPDRGRPVRDHQAAGLPARGAGLQARGHRGEGAGETHRSGLGGGRAAR